MYVASTAAGASVCRHLLVDRVCAGCMHRVCATQGHGRVQGLQEPTRTRLCLAVSAHSVHVELSAGLFVAACCMHRVRATPGHK